MKFVVTVTLLLLVVIIILGFLNARSQRYAGLIEARHYLKLAQDDYVRTGSVTNHSQYYKIWLTTNIVTVDGMAHQCQFMIQHDQFYNEGSLAMATNGTLIWIGNEKVKLIKSGYTPRLFPPGF